MKSYQTSAQVMSMLLIEIPRHTKSIKAYLPISCGKSDQELHSVNLVKMPQQSIMFLWQDEDPYVRKTAAVSVAKLHDINGQLVEDQGFLDLLKDLLSDSNPMV